MGVLYAKVDGEWIPISMGPVGPVGPAGPTGPQGPQGIQGLPGVVQAVIAGTNVTVDSTNPAQPIITSLIQGNGSALTNLNASQLTTGTVPSARMSGAYTGITQVGTLTGPVTIANDTSGGGSNLILNTTAGANEGGQIGFGGGSSYSTAMILDRFQDSLRLVSGTTTRVTVSASEVVLGPGVNQIRFDYGGGWYMSDATWIRTYGDKNVWAGAGLIGSQGGGTFADGGTAPASGYCLRLGSGLQFVQANPTISASSWVGFPGGLYASGGTAYFANRSMHRGGIQNDSSGSLTIYNQLFVEGGHANAQWNSQNIVVHTPSGGGNNEVGISWWNDAYSLAPFVRCYGPFGERIDFVNSASSAYIEIDAAVFHVQTSSRRTKKDITVPDDDALLNLMAPVRTHRFMMKVRPQKLRKSQRFQDLDKRWQATGRAPLVPKAQHYEPHDHDCLIDGCPDPCLIKLNDRPKYGLMADDLYEACPETVGIGEDLLPDGYYVEQIASMAFGGVGALLRKIERLEQRVKELEAA